MHIPHHVRACVIFVCIAAASAAVAEESPVQPRPQEFLVTAYYSPLPGQCCYVRGNLISDIVLNGAGIRSADGTPVYPGMAAAPKSYPFGTRISLPGLGVVTVHDRGGAIVEGEKGVHRLDLWVGPGEEGLARALAFGVRRVSGTVHVAGSHQPAESIDLRSLPSPPSVLRSYKAVDLSLLEIEASSGDNSYSVWILQDALARAGYFPQAPTGVFGHVTMQALQRYLKDHELKEPSDTLTEKTASFLMASLERSASALSPLNKSGKSGIASLQRTLRFLGYYDGRTDGIDGSALRKAVTRLQLEHGLIGSAHDPAAGRVGPQTRGVILQKWKAKIIARRAGQLLLLHRIQERIAEGDMGKTLAAGDRGEAVTRLQRHLADLRYMGRDRITGTFGQETRKALVAYQIENGIVPDANARGAGVLGPATSQHMRSTLLERMYRQVRAEGWEAGMINDAL